MVLGIHYEIFIYLLHTPVSTHVAAFPEAIFEHCGRNVGKPSSPQTHYFYYVNCIIENLSTFCFDIDQESKTYPGRPSLLIGPDFFEKGQIIPDR